MKNSGGFCKYHQRNVKAGEAATKCIPRKCGAFWNRRKAAKRINERLDKFFGR